MYTIGKISKLCNISIKTLRYYDEIGLLKPAFVSPENGYRYYTEQEIQKITLIKYYKELGFKLDNIKLLILHYELNTLDLYFEEELARLQFEMEEAKRKYFSIKQWQALIQQGKELKQRAAQNYEIKTMPSYSTITYNFDYDKLATQHVESAYSDVFVEFCRAHSYYTFGPFIVRYAEMEARVQGTVKAVQCYSAVYEQEKGNPAHRQVIGGIPVISYIHKGSYAELPAVYSKITVWAREHGITLVGDSYERYIVDSWSTQQVEEYVTEILIPVKE